MPSAKKPKGLQKSVAQLHGRKKPHNVTSSIVIAKARRNPPCAEADLPVYRLQKCHAAPDRGAVGKFRVQAVMTFAAVPFRAAHATDFILQMGLTGWLAILRGEVRKQPLAVRYARRDELD